MKTLRQIISEVAQPKAGDEKDFKDKHIIDKVDHPVAPDHAFTGNTKKAPKRRADYDKGEDETVYEGSFDVPTAEGGEHDTEDSHVKYKKGNKPSKSVNEAVFVIPEEILATEKNAFHTAAANAHKSGAKHFAFGGKKYPVTMSKDAASTFAGKGSMKKEAMDPVGKEDGDIDNDGDKDKSDKYLHNRRKAIGKAIRKEEVELDEATFSMDIDGNYKKNAASGALNAGLKINFKQHGGATEMILMGDKDKITKFLKARKVPSAEINNGFVKEEAEELDEISRDLARRYIRKVADKTNTGELSTKEVMKRRPGVNLAGKKAYPGVAGEQKVRATESVELDEISKKTLGSYIKKANISAMDQARKSGEYNNPDQPKNFSKAMDRMRGIKKATDKLVAKEEVEQLDELSPNTLHSYIKKAAGNMAGNAAVAAAQASSSMKKSSPDVKRKIKNRMMGISGASGRLADKANMAEDAYEEIPMMMSQLEFICYAAEEIMDYLDMGIDPEEWYQNKLSNAYQTMMSLYSYARGEMRMTSRSGGSGYYDDMYGEEVEQIDEISQDKLRDYHAAAALDLKKKREKLDKGTLTSKDYKQGQNRVTGLNRSANKMEEVELEEDITKMSHGRLKWHMNSGVPHGSYTKDEMKKERDRRLKTDPMGYRSAKAGLNEVTHTALKKTISYTDSQGKSRTRNVPISNVDRDADGEEKIRESVELTEVFNQGIVKLKDGSSVILKKEDADLLNQMLKDLSSANRKKMEEVAMKDKTGFNEILSFAREAL